MAATLKEHQRNIRKEALREMLSKGRHLEEAAEIANKFAKPIKQEEQYRLKTKFDMHMKLVDKYLPSLKAVELSGDSENPVGVVTRIELVPLCSDDTAG
jgi:hypothetical protein